MKYFKDRLQKQVDDQRKENEHIKEELKKQKADILKQKAEIELQKRKFEALQFAVTEIKTEINKSKTSDVGYPQEGMFTSNDFLSNK